MEYEIWQSALKHGISPRDILHALRNHIRVYRQDEGLEMHIDPDTAGNLLEIGVVRGTAVAHAMKARNKFIRRKP